MATKILRYTKELVIVLASYITMLLLPWSFNSWQTNISHCFTDIIYAALWSMYDNGLCLIRASVWYWLAIMCVCNTSVHIIPLNTRECTRECLHDTNSIVLVRKCCFSLVLVYYVKNFTNFSYSNSHMTKILTSFSFSYSFRLNLWKLY